MSSSRTPAPESGPKPVEQLMQFATGFMVSSALKSPLGVVEAIRVDSSRPAPPYFGQRIAWHTDSWTIS